MRVIVFYDLPTTTSKESKEYRYFHQFLIKNGFIMQQYSVYSKLALNRTQAEQFKEVLRSNTPVHGTVQCMIITERQYANIEYFAGKRQTKILDNENRYVEI